MLISHHEKRPGWTHSNEFQRNNAMRQQNLIANVIALLNFVYVKVKLEKFCYFWWSFNYFSFHSLIYLFGSSFSRDFFSIVICFVCRSLLESSPSTMLKTCHGNAESCCDCHLMASKEWREVCFYEFINSSEHQSSKNSQNFLWLNFSVARKMKAPWKLAPQSVAVSSGLKLFQRTFFIINFGFCSSWLPMLKHLNRSDLLS